MKELKKLKYEFIIFVIAAIFILIFASMMIGQEKINMEYEEYQNLKNVINILMGITLILLVIYFICNTSKIFISPNEEYQNEIPPYLAELVTRGKFNIRNYITAFIIDLNLRKKIEILYDDKIRLTSLSNLEGFEIETIKLIFTNSLKVGTLKKEEFIKTIMMVNTVKEGKMTSFKRINKDIIERKPDFILKRIKELRLGIEKYLLSKEIISMKKTKLLRICTIISFLITFNSLIIPSVVLERENIILLILTHIAVSIFTAMLLWEKLNNKYLFKREKAINATLCTIDFMFFMSIILSTGFMSFKTLYLCDIKLFVIQLLIYIINILMIFKTKNFALSDFGIEEKNKLIGFKKYIKRANIEQLRDFNSVSNLDKYAAYSAGFGIPNKSANRFFRELYNLNFSINYIINILLI